MSESSATTVRSSDGSAIAYETHGDGPGVILIDGAMCFRDSGPMQPLSARLDDEFTVLSYDRRGRGQSEDRASGASTLEALDRELDDVDALVAAIDAASAQSVPALVGISSGGALALRAAARLRHRVRAVVVYEPPYMPEPLAGMAHTYTDALGLALASGDRDAAVSLFLGRVGMPKQAIDGTRRSPAWSGMTTIAPTLAYDDAAMGDSRIPVDLIESITVPVLALAGGASPDMMQYGAREVAAHARRGAFDTLAEQGHDADASVLAERVRDFLKP